MPSPIAARAPHSFTILAGLAALLAVLELGRLVIFAAYPVPPPAWSVAPWSPFMTRHACTTAYWSAATTIEQTPDVYSLAASSAGRDPATGRPLPRQIGPFSVDPYEYPPTFLLVPRALAVVAPEFVTFRHVWLLLNAALVIAGMVAIARRVDAATGSRSLWLLPLAIVPLTTMYALQMGNAQLVFVVLAAVALLAFERGRHALGGLLLAYAIVGKLFPALLLVYLAIRREWRAVGWTAGWAVILTLVTIADIGWAPFPAFFDHLPRLLSGEAFPMLRAPVTPPNSQSIPGLVLKLPSLGGPDVPFVSLKIAGWIYSAVILWATVRLALRPLAPRVAPLAWLVVLGLAALRSPFIPSYGAFPGAWIAAILLAVCWNDARRWWWIFGLWLTLVPTTAGPAPIPLGVISVFTTIQTVAVLALMAIAVRVGREARDGQPSPVAVRGPATAAIGA